MTKILINMLLIGLMSCYGAVMHPAAEPYLDSGSKKEKHATFDITEKKFNSYTQGQLAAFIHLCGGVQAAFYDALEHNLVWALAPLMAMGADINAIDINDGTLLTNAAFEGNENATKILLQARADIETTDEAGMTPLNMAAWNGHENIINILLQTNANIHTPDSNGDTPLHHAAYNGHDGAVGLLVAAGAIIDAVNVDNDTALMKPQEADFQFLDDGVNIAQVDLNLERCAEILINAYRAQLERRYPTRRLEDLQQNDLMNLGDLSSLNQDCLGHIMNWFSDKDLRTIACISRGCNKLANNEIYYRLPYIKAEKFDAFIEPVRLYLLTTPEKPYFEQRSKNIRQKMMTLLQNAKKESYFICGSESACGAPVTSMTSAQLELDAPCVRPAASDAHAITMKRKTDDDDDLPQAKRPRFTADEEAAPAQLGLDAPHGVFRPQPMDTGCAVAQERNREHMQAARATRFEIIKACADCQGIDYPLDLTHLLTCCLSSICKDHFRQIAQSQDPTCPYCTAPLR